MKCLTSQVCFHEAHVLSCDLADHHAGLRCSWRQRSWPTCWTTSWQSAPSSPAQPCLRRPPQQDARWPRRLTAFPILLLEVPGLQWICA